MADFNWFSRRLLNFRGVLNGIGALILVMFILDEKINFKIGGLQNQSDDFGIIRRRVTQVDFNSSIEPITSTNPTLCSGLYEHKGYDSKCEYLIANPQCSSVGYLNYLIFFYCDCQKSSFIAYVTLAIWLFVLFYLLGNTAADYFCCSLEKLSDLMNLAPTLAGVTLLPLGNGAPDVFASIAAFVGNDKGDVGLNGVLGGALFVTCIVVGAVAFSVSNQRVRINKRCFIRDVCFLLFTLFCVLIILVVGEVSVGGAVAYAAIYVVYVAFVAAYEILGSDNPLLPVKLRGDCDDDTNMYASLIQFGAENEVPMLEPKLPHWIWTTNVAIYSNEDNEHSSKPIWGWNGDDVANEKSYFSCSKLCKILEFPLILTRRLTIPIVDKDRWSKGYAVASSVLAPLFLALLWNTQDELAPHSGLIAYLIGGVIGISLGILTMIYTKNDKPPEKFLFPWAFGGFFMSIIWFYIVANELVALLVSIGVIFEINPSILALTVLAWGNSMGDLMSNFALAMNGKDGVQIAMAGCYAGPMFNTLVGLGFSMLIGAWSKRPISYIVPKDSSLYCTVAFLILGLVWALVVLPRNNMCPNKTLGIGLVAIYLAFLVFRLTAAVGSLEMDGFR